jgi:hypothetical protein
MASRWLPEAYIPKGTETLNPACIPGNESSYENNTK